MICWYVGVIITTEEDSSDEVMDKFFKGEVLEENGFDLYKLPHSLEEIQGLILEDKGVFDKHSFTKTHDFDKSQGDDEESSDKQPLLS